MAHNARVRGSADAWANILRSELAALDTGLRTGVNDVDGGVYAPASQISIGGSGLYVTGPTFIGYGGTLSCQSGPSVQLQDGDYPVIDPLDNTVHSSQTILYPCASARGQVTYIFHGRREDGALQAWSPMYDPFDGFGQRPSLARMRLRSHDGAVLSKLQVHFRVGAVHSAIPTIMPAVRVYADGPLGNFALLTSQAAGADPNGYIYVPKPPSPTAWLNGGVTQTLTIPIDQNATIGTTGFDYLVELVDEQGLTGWPWQLTYLPSVKYAATSNLSLTGAATIDGVAVTTGDRVLAVAQTNPVQNGIWSANTAGAWTRTADWFTTATIPQGIVVPVSSGNTLAGLLYQVTTTLVGAVVDVSAVTFQTHPDQSNATDATAQFVAHGTIWQDVLATFSSIQDFRPQ